MYESEADEKHLDFIAGTPAMVSIGVSRLFCFSILVLCSKSSAWTFLPYHIWGLTPEGEGECLTISFRPWLWSNLRWTTITSCHFMQWKTWSLLLLETTKCLFLTCIIFHFVSVCHLDRRFSDATQQRGKVVILHPWKLLHRMLELARIWLTKLVFRALSCWAFIVVVVIGKFLVS